MQLGHGKRLLLPDFSAGVHLPRSCTNMRRKTRGILTSYSLLLLFGYFGSRPPGPLIRTLNLWSPQTSCPGPALPAQFCFLTSGRHVLPARQPILPASLTYCLSPNTWCCFSLLGQGGLKPFASTLAPHIVTVSSQQHALCVVCPLRVGHSSQFRGHLEVPALHKFPVCSVISHPLTSRSTGLWPLIFAWCLLLLGLPGYKDTAV